MKILINIPATAKAKAMLAEKFAEQELIYNENPTDFELESCDVIFGQPTEEQLKICKNLKMLQSSSAGVEGYCSDGVLPVETKLCCATGAFGAEIAEVMLAMLLSLKKQLHHYRDQQNANNWEFFAHNKPIRGKNVLILGLGDIGMNFAKLMNAHNCHIVGIKKNLNRTVEYVHEVYTQNELDAEIPKADVIALCLPETAETREIMSSARIFAMKKGAVLINVGRGSAVDNTALLKAVKSGHLDGAAIDVTGIEPLPKVHELWTEANIIITPHVAGKSFSPYLVDDIAEIFAENLTALIAGKNMPTEVCKTSGYMKSRL